MGVVVKGKLTVTNPGIIDYAENGKRSDFMDIYLSSKCRFFLGTDSGMLIFLEMFKRPIVSVNLPRLPFISTWTHTSLVIPKKVYSKKEGWLLKFSELLEFLIIPCNPLIIKHLEFIENTSEEITAVALEMDDRLNGIWETNEEDEELQRRFWALFGPDKLKSPSLRMGAEFLRQNRDLLES